MYKRQRDDRTPSWVPVSVGLLVGWAVLARYLTGVVCAVPVSYTHLRAHETVLDLVCRLLLEKKKYTLL